MSGSVDFRSIRERLKIRIAALNADLLALDRAESLLTEHSSYHRNTTPSIATPASTQERRAAKSDSDGHDSTGAPTKELPLLSAVASTRPVQPSLIPGDPAPPIIPFSDEPTQPSIIPVDEEAPTVICEEDRKLIDFMDRVEARFTRRPTEKQARAILALEAIDIEDYWAQAERIMNPQPESPTSAGRLRTRSA